MMESCSCDNVIVNGIEYSVGFIGFGVLEVGD
jgi:hypothetical protein